MPLLVKTFFLWCNGDLQKYQRCGFNLEADWYILMQNSVYKTKLFPWDLLNSVYFTILNQIKADLMWLFHTEQ